MMMRNQHRTAAAIRFLRHRICRLPDGRAIHLRAPALPPRSSCASPAAASAVLRRGLGTDLARSIQVPTACGLVGRGPRAPRTQEPRFLPSPHAPPAGSSFRRSISTARRLPSSVSTSGAMKIAVEGCMHGELDIVYDTLRRLEEAEGVKIDLLLCCGDFQAVRNENDLQCVNVPQKYRTMNSFWKYYSGEAVAPYPTIFIGGNHEASNYLWELYYGGWAAPNIYFLGFAGVVKFGNIRIGGLSGIHNKHHYHLGHYERPPYNEDTIRSVYHVRHYDVLKLMHLKEPLDVFLSHDWPLGITEYGNWQKLIRMKKHFEEEVINRTLGSKPAAELLNKLKPPYWFSAHLHCKFPAIIQHGKNGPTTKFLALDKCIPGRNFLQVIDIPSSPGPYEIQYDEEWLAITRKFNSVFPLARTRFTMRDEQLDTQEECQWVRSKLNTRGAKPFDFVQTAPSFNPSNTISTQSRTVCYRNPQTESFLQLLELPYLLDSSKSEGFGRNESSSQPGNTLDDEDIELPGEDEDALENAE